MTKNPLAVGLPGMPGSQMILKTLKMTVMIVTFFILTSLVIVRGEAQPGHMGQGYVLPGSLTGSDKVRVSRGWKDHQFNQYVSDLIPLDRPLPDYRDPSCKALPAYRTESLPSASVVICFHNEARSTLLRSVHSVLNRSPPESIREIILVDDASDRGDLKDLESLLFSNPTEFGKVKILRLAQRHGIVRARLAGLEAVKSEVVVFLDSHIECTEGWLEPLLDRIQADPTVVISPIIDVIEADTFQYTPVHLQLGGFDWDLRFSWIPPRQLLMDAGPADPVPTPTHAGGLFAINVQRFRELGTYDPGFRIWGSENLELSFKSWMCGGRLEIHPCSRVGHVFRSAMPYSWGDEEGGQVGALRCNNIRLAQVWMDGYARHYYKAVGIRKLGGCGDVSERRALRSRLRCRSFQWYLRNVYPELQEPAEMLGMGQIRHVQTNMCLGPPGLYGLSLFPCQNVHRWVLSSVGELQLGKDRRCLDYTGDKLILFPCHGQGGNQKWEYLKDKKWIQHGYHSGHCLAADMDRLELTVRPCRVDEDQWEFQKD